MGTAASLLGLLLTVIGTEQRGIEAFAMEIDEQQLGLSGQTGLLKWLKMSFAGTDLERHSYLLHFNADGTLIAAGLLESTEDLGTAGSVQAIVSIKQIVDTTAFENDELDASRWGCNLLDPLPVMLNNAQNLNTGAAGLEQSGTTTKIGQHTRIALMLTGDCLVKPY